MSQNPRSQDGTDTKQVNLFDDRWPWEGRPLADEGLNTPQDDEQHPEGEQSTLDRFY